MFILMIIQNYSIPQILTYNTLAEALATYHTELGYRHESRTSTVCVIFDRKGNEVVRDYYDATELANYTT